MINHNHGELVHSIVHAGDGDAGKEIKVKLKTVSAGDVYTVGITGKALRLKKRIVWLYLSLEGRVGQLELLFLFFYFLQLELVTEMFKMNAKINILILHSQMEQFCLSLVSQHHHS